MNSEKILEIAAKALFSKKGRDVNAVKIDELTTVADYFVFATATSSTHVRALADEVEEKLKENGITPHHIEGKSTGWILLDYTSVVVHIFTPHDREFYGLDRMWDGGKSIDVAVYDITEGENQ